MERALEFILPWCVLPLLGYFPSSSPFSGSRVVLCISAVEFTSGCSHFPCSISLPLPSVLLHFSRFEVESIKIHNAVFVCRWHPGKKTTAMYWDEHTLGASKRSLLVVYETAGKNPGPLNSRCLPLLYACPFLQTKSFVLRLASLLCPCRMIGAANHFNFPDDVCSGVFFHSQQAVRIKVAA
eukprot:6006410-Pleurochrysis_carterae.AAC.1